MRKNLARARFCADGYVLKIVKAVPCELPETFDFYYDVAEGEDAGIFQAKHDAEGYRLPHFRWSNKFRTEREFTLLLPVLFCANPGFKERYRGKASDFEERIFGAVFGKEEVVGPDWQTVQRFKIRSICDPSIIRAHRYAIPKVKKVWDIK